MNKVNINQEIALELDPEIVHWCLVRVMAHASYVHSDKHILDITLGEAIDAWAKTYGGE